jgi:hypothetical protein
MLFPFYGETEQWRSNLDEQNVTNGHNIFLTVHCFENLNSRFELLNLDLNDFHPVKKSSKRIDSV